MVKVMSRILFVVSRPIEINTSASIRNKAMLEGLVLNGHKVDVVTAMPDMNHAAYDESLSVEGVSITRIPMNNAQKLASLSRKNKVFLIMRALVFKWMAKHEIYDYYKFITCHTEYVDLSDNRYDFIISSSDPKSSHLFVMKLLEKQKDKFHGKWIQIWGDPFLADITRIGKNAKRIKAEESRLLQAADMVFYVSRLTLNQQKLLYPEQCPKMRYTPIPYVQEHITKNRYLDVNSEINLAYCGDYSPLVRNIGPLYDAINNHSGFRLVICGASTDPLCSTENVEVRGRVPYEIVHEVEDEADVLIFLANRKGAQIPGKIYQYAGTNKPILFILDGDEECLKEQFHQYGRFVFAYNSSTSIMQALEQIRCSDMEYIPLKEFSKECIMQQFLMTAKESV